MGFRAYSVCVQIIFCAAYTRRFVRSESRLSSREAHFDSSHLLYTMKGDNMFVDDMSKNTPLTPVMQEIS